MKNGATVQKKSETIGELLERKKVKISELLPDKSNVNYLINSALLAISRNPDLPKCTVSSIYTSVLNAAEVNLDFTPIKQHAFLVPYRNNKKDCWEAQFMPGYRGFIHIAVRAGVVKNIEAHVVYGNDEFYPELGSNPQLHHRPEFKSDRGKIIGAYAIAFFNTGGFQYEWMLLEDLNKIENRTKYKDKSGNAIGPWKEYKSEMQRKTPIRKLFKSLPFSSPELEKALVYDNQSAGVEIIEKNETGKKRTEILADTLSKQTKTETTEAEFEDIPAGKDTYTPPPEPEPEGPETESATQKQITAIYTKTNTEYGLDDIAALRLACAITGQSIVSMKNLSKEEASHVLDTLEHPDTVKGYLAEISGEKKDLFDK